MPIDDLPAAEDALVQLDELLASSTHDKWQGFYADRGKPYPFFALVPDENLCSWAREGLIPSGKALDLGCGNGRNAVFMARRAMSVEGVDFSPSAIEWAKSEIARANLSVRLRCASVFDLALEPGSYDLVYDSGCFHHIPPHRRGHYVGLVAEVLKPGGVFGLVCFAPDGGSGYSDTDVYDRASMGGGLGYSEARLREIWSESFHIESIRRMRDLGADSDMLGKSYLWALLGRKR